MAKSEGKEVRSNLKILAVSAYFVLFSIFISKVLGYAYRLIIAREFGPEAYGLFSLAVMVIGILVSVASLGLYEGLARFIPMYRGTKEIHKARYVLRTTLKFTAILSVLFTIILFLCSDFIAITILKDPHLAPFLRVFSISLPFAIIAGIYLAALRSYEKIKEYSLVLNTLQTLSRVVALVVLIYLGMRSISIAYSYVISIIVVFLSSYYYCKSRIPEILSKHNISIKKGKEITSSLLAYSLPLLVTGIVYSLFFWIDSFTIAYLRTATDVGVYNGAVTIALLLLVAPEIFMQLFFPLISKEHAKGNKKLISELSKQVAKWIFLVNLPLFTLFILFPGAGINILFGPEFISASNSLRILAVGTLIYSIALVSYNLINMSGKSKKTLVYMIVAAATNLILNFILIPMSKIGFIDNASGINGAALATTLSMGLVSVLFIMEAYHTLSVIPFRRKMGMVLLAWLISVLALLLLRSLVSLTLIKIALLTIFFFALYGVMLIALRVFDHYDKELISLFIAKLKDKARIK